MHRERSDGPRRLKPGLELGVTAVGIPVAPEQSLVAECGNESEEVMSEKPTKADKSKISGDEYYEIFMAEFDRVSRLGRPVRLDPAIERELEPLLDGLVAALLPFLKECEGLTPSEVDDKWRKMMGRKARERRQK